MRTLYRNLDPRETADSERILALVAGNKPDLVIVETENIQTVTDVVECGKIWSTLDGWTVMFASVRRGERSACIHVASPWELSKSEASGNARHPMISDLGRIEVGGPRPGVVHVAWCRDGAVADIDIES
jgi:hypothetical protein